MVLLILLARRMSILSTFKHLLMQWSTYGSSRLYRIKKYADTDLNMIVFLEIPACMRIPVELAIYGGNDDHDLSLVGYGHFVPNNLGQTFSVCIVDLKIEDVIIGSIEVHMAAQDRWFVDKTGTVIVRRNNGNIIRFIHSKADIQVQYLIKHLKMVFRNKISPVAVNAGMNSLDQQIFTANVSKSNGPERYLMDGYVYEGDLKKPLWMCDLGASLFLFRLDEIKLLDTFGLTISTIVVPRIKQPSRVQETTGSLYERYIRADKNQTDIVLDNEFQRQNNDDDAQHAVEKNENDQEIWHMCDSESFDIGQKLTQWVNDFACRVVQSPIHWFNSSMNNEPIKIDLISKRTHMEIMTDGCSSNISTSPNTPQGQHDNQYSQQET